MTPRLALSLAASLLFTAACGDASTCTTEDDCFRGEVCTAQGKCAKAQSTPDMDAPDMGAMDAGGDMTPPSDMADMADMADLTSPSDMADMVDMVVTDMRTDMRADPCEGVTCSKRGTCNVQGQLPVCTCQLGYDAQGTTCVAAPAAYAITSGAEHACAIKSGELICWGRNDLGQIGAGAPTPRRLPTSILSAPITSHVAAGAQHTCAISAGELYCWGDNAHGKLGVDPATRALNTPPDNPVLPTPATALAAGSQHTCAISDDALWCWGDHSGGQLGFGMSQPAATHIPQRVTLADTPTAVAAGRAHTCAIAGGALYCWGTNTQLQLGDPDVVRSDSPRLVPTMDSGVTDVFASEDATCALKNSELYCWGAIPSANINADEPTRLTTFGANAKLAALGPANLCVINASTLYCWGKNDMGQVGNGTNNQANTPVTVAGFGNTYAVAVGARHTCGIKNATTPLFLCWGDNTSGQLGIDPATTQANTPRTVTLP